LVSQITSDGEPRYGGADGGYPTNNSATTTPLSWYDINCKHSVLLAFWLCEMQFTGDCSEKSAASSTSAEECGKDIEINKKRRSMGGTKGICT
jgi:hypothetical protein